MTANTVWEIQNSDKALFPDVLWDKPENKIHANSALIIGGSSTNFHLVSDAYAYAQKINFAQLKFYLPKSLEKLTRSLLINTEYGDINKSGSFAMTNLANLISLSAQYDSTILIGNLGESSETNLLFEKLSNQIINKNLILCNDSLQFLNNQQLTTNPEKFTLIVELNQLQKIIRLLNFSQNIKSSDDLTIIADIVSKLAKKYLLKIVLRMNQHVLVFADDKCSLTKKNQIDDKWSSKISVEIASWMNFNTVKKYERLTTAAFSI